MALTYILLRTYLFRGEAFAARGLSRAGLEDLQLLFGAFKSFNCLGPLLAPATFGTSRLFHNCWGFKNFKTRARSVQSPKT